MTSLEPSKACLLLGSITRNLAKRLSQCNVGFDPPDLQAMS